MQNACLKSILRENLNNFRINCGKLTHFNFLLWDRILIADRNYCGTAHINLVDNEFTSEIL